MAKVNTQIIPPSLISGYTKVFTVGNPRLYGFKNVGLNQTARIPQALHISNPALQVQIDAAKWLVEQWQPRFKSQFYADRLAEIKAFIFDEKYWHLVTPSRDRTEWGEPEINAYEGPINLVYDDPLRIKTKCLFELWSKVYDTPFGEGTSENPRPGWKGTVIDQIWRDLWFAQRRLIYGLPVTINFNNRRPVLIDLQSQIEATASFKASKLWFARAVWPKFLNETGTAYVFTNYLQTGWLNSDLVPINLVSDSGQYFHCTDNQRLLRTAYNPSWKPNTTAYNRLSLVVATPPSRGRYFAGNDNVQVSHNETVNVLIGKKPSG
ncbi:MAG: hypothetical protein RLZZ419_265 [Pseudomonadota bacterium]|jgi:hypothetical protein